MMSRLLSLRDSRDPAGRAARRAAWWQRLAPRGRTLATAIPYGWLLLFFLVPFLFVLQISFSEVEIASPPYRALVERSEDVLNIALNLGNYTYIFGDPLYFDAYLGSLETAAVTTAICLLIGYPIAYTIARAPEARRNTLLMLVMLPFWTSFLVRVYAWMGILDSNGLVNQALLALGLVDAPLQLMHTQLSVQIVMVYAYLPFMILPLFSNLVKLDGRLLEAAADLGCRPWKTFLTVTLPLSKNGVVAGSMLVFIPAVGEFVIPELVGTPESLMIGKVLWMEFFDNNNWPMAASVTIVMLALLILPIVYLHKREEKALARAARR
ncbi:ABC transporter permease subunit [Crenobacter luteus]|uniref:Spermidine/putrescine ABC transporter permease n=1 Tax=Crenobacter luteus TaxID=1452487 RepID=A0A165FK49_9NEIS|nr:ABC transporter permease subunit [Crenobacter luteus]KZE33522.1 spermidine/putrescine ABC transporter permease [Crenobacter luteus]